MNRLLRTLLDRAADLAPTPVVTSDALRRHPPAAVAAAERGGLLAPLPPAEAVGCDSCGADHVEPVVWADTPNDGPPRAFLWCPADGRVRVDPARLLRWAVAPAALGRAVAGADPDERLAGRVWKLGPVRVGGVHRVGWLVAGWRGEAGLADRVPELVQPTAVVFVPDVLPPAAVWGAAVPPVVVPLADVLTLTDGGLGVNPTALAAHLPAATLDGLAHADSGKSDRPAADEPLVVAASPPPVPLPPGTRWEEVSLHLDGDTVRIQTGGTDAVLTFADAGFADRRSRSAPSRPNAAWHLLTRLARRRGVLGTGDHIDTKPAALRSRVTDLAERLRALTGVAGPPPGRPASWNGGIKPAGWSPRSGSPSRPIGGRRWCTPPGRTAPRSPCRST